MYTQIITAVISAGAAIIVGIINSEVQRRAQDAKNGETIALITYKLDELSRRMDKHNELIERTYRLEESVSVLSEKMSVANHRIDDLERNVDDRR